MPGPAPKPDAQRRRRNPTIAMTRLPAEGRQGDPPMWPLRADLASATRLERARDERMVIEDEVNSDDPPAGAHAKLSRIDQRIALLEEQIRVTAEMESELWVDLWRLPQAVQWERQSWTREVAQYVRWKVAAELGNLKASTESRQLADRLGLSPLAMLRLRWEIAPDEVAHARAEKAAPRAASSARRRLRVVDADGVAGA